MVGYTALKIVLNKFELVKKLALFTEMIKFVTHIFM